MKTAGSFQLIEFRLAITKAGLFLIVYALALGTPFFLYIYGHYFPAVCIALFLASAAPFIYTHFKGQAEDRLLADQRTYQDVLLRASQGLSRYKTIEEITHFVICVLLKAIRVRNAAFYLFDGESYTLRDLLGEEGAYASSVDGQTPGVLFLKRFGAFSLDMSKLHARGPAKFREGIHCMAETFKGQPVSVALPIVRGEKMPAFILIGEKSDGVKFSDRDIEVLNVIAEHSGLALENAFFWRDAMRRVEEESLKQRVASLDMMASSLAHEIDNPNSIIIGQSELMGELINDPAVSMPDALRSDFTKSIRFVIESSKRVAGMVDDILEYSRMGTGILKPLDITFAIESFLRLIEPQRKRDGVVLEKDIQEALPLVMGDKVQIEEVLINFALNSMHAVKHNTGMRDITLKVFQKNEEILRVEFGDNGHGIPVKLLKDIFLPSVTTKGSVEGTGLGLYRVRKIVDNHKGQVWAESEGEGKGAKFIVEMPVHKGDAGEDRSGSEKVLKMPRKIF